MCLEASYGALISALDPVLCHCLHVCCLFAACSVRRLSVEQLIAEDAALDKSCTDALSFVRTCEQLRGYNKQVQPNQVSSCWPCWRKIGMLC
jgi:hypothetical protein